MELLFEDTDLDTKRKYAVEEEEEIGSVNHSAYIDVKSILAENDNIDETEDIAVPSLASIPVAFNMEDEQEVMSYSSVGYYEINKDADNDIIALQKSDALVNAGAGNDIVKLDGENNILNGNEGNDVIIAQNSGAERIKDSEIGNLDTQPLKIAAILNGGEGNDIYKISTLAQGENYIINQSVAGGKDRDSLLLTAFNKTDFDFSKTEKGYLLMTYLPTNATIEIQGWNEHALNRISFKDGYVNNAEVEALTVHQQDVIKTFMQVLDNTSSSGSAAVDEALVVCSNGKYTSLNALVEEFKANCSEYSGKSICEQRQFLRDFCGIELNNADTGSITGSDAGGAIVKDASTIVPDVDGLSIEDFTYNPSAYNRIQANDFNDYVTGVSEIIPVKECYSAVVNGITLYWNEDNWSDLGTDRRILQQIMGGLINSWTESALNLVEESYGMALNEVGSLLSKLNDGTYGLQVCFKNNPDSEKVAYLSSRNLLTGEIVGEQDDFKVTGVDEVLVINTAYYQDLITDVSGNSSHDQIYLDRLIAHELVHGVMAANVNNNADLPLFILEGLAELVHGADDSRRDEILAFVNTYNNKLMDDTFNANNYGVSVDGGTYSGGYLLLRYLAKQVINPTVIKNLEANSLSNNIVRVNTDTDFSDIIAVNAEAGVAKNNTIKVYDGAVNDLISVNASGSAKAENNHVYVFDGTIQGDIYGAKVESGNATGNSVVIGTETERYGKSLQNVYGAASNSGDVSDNGIEVIGQGTNCNVSSAYGGFSCSGNVENNVVNLVDVMVNGNTYGGYSEDGNVSNNTISTQGSIFIMFSPGDDQFSPTYGSSMFLHESYGGYSVNGDVSNNLISSYNTTYDADVYGGKSVNGNVYGNTIEFNNVQTHGLYGAYVVGGEESIGLAKDNSITIKGEGYSSIAFGTYVEYGNAINNKVVIDTDSYGFNYLCGALVLYGNAEENNLIVKNTTLDHVTGVSIGDMGHNEYVCGSGSVTNNTVNVANCKLTHSGKIQGVISNSSDVYAAYNIVTVKDSILTSNVEGVSFGGTAEYNRVYVENTTLASVIGAQAKIADHNTVVIKNVNILEGLEYGNSFDNSIYGGLAHFSSANNNDVTVEECDLIENVYGGYVSGGSIINLPEASGNLVNIISGNIKGSVYGGASTWYASNNMVNIYDGNITGNVYGGYINDYSYLSSASYNSVTIYGGTMNEVYGGYNEYNDSCYNEVIIKGGTFNKIYGGFSIQGNVYNNNITLDNFVVSENTEIIAGYSERGNVYDNTITLKNVDLTGKFVNITTNATMYGNIIGNTTNITDGSIVGGIVGTSVLGDRSSQGIISGNTTRVDDGAVVTGTLYGVQIKDSNSTINVNANNVELLNGSINDVYGVYALGGTDDNHISNTYIKINPKINASGNIIAAYLELGKISKNIINVQGGVLKDIIGGLSTSATISENWVSINSGNCNNIYGGKSVNGNVTSNRVFMEKKANINGKVYGGYSENGIVDNNYIYMDHFENEQLYAIGGYIEKINDEGISLWNDVLIQNESVVRGACGTVVASGCNGRAGGSVTLFYKTKAIGDLCGVETNLVEISSCDITVDNESVVEGTIYGGKTLNSNVNYSRIFVNNSTVNDVYAGYTNKGNITNSEVKILGDSIVNGNVYVGYTEEGLVDNGNVTIKDNAIVNGTVEGGNGSDTITIGSNNAITVNANEGDDLIFVQSQNNKFDGGTGLDTYVFDWAMADGNIISDTNESDNIIQFVNAANLTVSKFNNGLHISDGTQTLTIVNADAIATIEVLGTDSKISYDIKSAMNSISTSEMSFSTDLASYATSGILSEEDRNRINIVTGNV